MRRPTRPGRTSHHHHAPPLLLLALALLLAACTTARPTTTLPPLVAPTTAAALRGRLTQLASRCALGTNTVGLAALRVDRTSPDPTAAPSIGAPAYAGLPTERRLRRLSPPYPTTSFDKATVVRCLTEALRGQPLPREEVNRRFTEVVFGVCDPNLVPLALAHRQRLAASLERVEAFRCDDFEALAEDLEADTYFVGRCLTPEEASRWPALPDVGFLLAAQCCREGRGDVTRSFLATKDAERRLALRRACGSGWAAAMAAATRE